MNALANDKMVAQAASDAILTDHWTARIDGIAHKLENLRIDLCGRTYTPHTLPALHEIR